MPDDSIPLNNIPKDVWVRAVEGPVASKTLLPNTCPCHLYGDQDNRVGADRSAGHCRAG